MAANPAIDTDRIYIGGCSNGGYMTMEMVITYPDYFAAAYPICEAYADNAITDEQLERVKNLPIWFIYAEDDSPKRKRGILKRCGDTSNGQGRSLRRRAALTVYKNRRNSQPLATAPVFAY